MRGCGIISQKTSRVGLLAGALFLPDRRYRHSPGCEPAAGAMQSQIKEQQQTLKLSKQELAKLNTQLKADEQAISAAAAKLEQTRQQLRQNQQKLASLQQDKLALEQQAKHQKQLLAKQAESAFQAGNHDYLKLLLNQQDPAKLSRALDYSTTSTRPASRPLKPCAPPVTSWPRTSRPPGETENRLQTLLGEQQDITRACWPASRAVPKVRNQLQQSVQADEQKLDKLVKAEKALKARLEELRRQQEERNAANGPSRSASAKIKAEQERQRRLEASAWQPNRSASRSSSGSQPSSARSANSSGWRSSSNASPNNRPRWRSSKAAARNSAKASSNGYGGLSTGGNLRWPVQGPILISYGSPRTAELKWKGTLIGASEGTQVKAVAPGQVVYADWLDGFGMLLVIDHGKGYMSLYGHNQSLLRQVGQKVEQGEPVALVGDSGGQERSGLYFEIRYQGEAINPTKWLARR